MKKHFQSKGIFISYRRNDVEDLVGRISDKLKSRFGKKRVFFDRHIPGGTKWKQHIDDALGTCHVALIFIGPDWLNRSPSAGNDELDTPTESKNDEEKTDYVEYEVKAVLNREPEIPCLPIVIGDAKDQLEQLPASIQELIARQWFPFRKEPEYFDRDMQSLIEQLNPKHPVGLLTLLGTLIAILMAGIIVLLIEPLSREKEPVTENSTPAAEPSLPSLFTDLHLNSLGMQFVPVEGTEVLFSKYETTVQEYLEFAQSTGTKVYPPAFGVIPSTNEEFKQPVNHPAVMVSWTDANRFCKWLTEREHEKAWLTGRQRYRLPTDKEWSTAVGLSEEAGESPEKKMMIASAAEIKNLIEVFPWNCNSWPPPNKIGNYGGEESISTDLPKFIEEFHDSHPFTSPVGAYPANKHLLSDLGGNVWEWCEDKLHADSEYHVLRGGSFRNITKERITSFFRNKDPAQARYNNVGFRCVIEFE